MHSERGRRRADKDKSHTEKPNRLNNKFILRFLNAWLNANALQQCANCGVRKTKWKNTSGYMHSYHMNKHRVPNTEYR